MNRRIAVGCLATAMGVWVNVALIGSVFADTKVVDPAGHGDYTTIQAAVNDLPNPGPRTIIVRAGTYHEAVSLSARNTQATNDNRRIIVMADTNTAPNLVIVTPPSGSSGVSLNQSRFITLQGLVITGVGGKNVPAVRLDGGSQDNEDIAIVGCQIHHNTSQGIQVLSNNPRTWIMNNLIRDNGTIKKTDYGVTVADGVGATVYMVNNTIVRNKADGVFVDVPRPLYLVNNLIVGNGGYGFQRAKGSIDPTAVTLLYNVFYANTAGDIANASQTLDATDSGNRTTAGNEGVGVTGCAFPNCGHTAALTALFVNPGAGATDFHLAAGSPAIDRGVNTFADGATTWVIVEDLEGHSRPQDGDGDCFTIADVGCYEAPAIPCQVDMVPPLARLFLGDGSGLISNVNANTLGGIPAAGYATTSGSYANMNVGTATFATTAGNALNLGNIPPGGYVQTGDTRVVRAITALYATGSGSVTVSGNTGTIEFGSGGWGGTNLWVLNGGPPLTNDEFEVITAGGLTGALSNYGSRVQLTLTGSGTATYSVSSGYATNAGSASTSSNALQLGGIVAASYSTTQAVETARINAIATNKVAAATYADSSGYATNAGSASTATFASFSLYATNAGSASSATSAGTASFATSAGSAGSATFAASSGYATNAGAATSAGTATFAASSGYATNAGTAASATTAGTATFAISSGFATNAGTASLAAGAGTATFAVSSGYATNAGAAPVPPLSDVLAVGNTSGTGIVMSAKDSATSHGFFFVDGSGNTNQVFGSGSNVAHSAPSGATGEVWDALNLPYPANTNGGYLGMSVGTATFAGSAATAAFADSTGTSTNALQLGGIVAAGYPTTNQLTAASNTLAAATLAITNGLPTTAITNGLETIAAAGALTNGLVGASVTNGLATPSVTNGLETIAAANTLSNTLAAATESARINAIATNKVAAATFADSGNYATNSGNAAFATSAGTAGSATSAGTATFSTSSGYATNAGSATSAAYSTSSGYATNAGSAAFATTADTAAFAVSSGYATNAGAAPVPPLANVLAVGNTSGTGIVMSAEDSTTSHGFFFVDGSGNTNQFLGSGSNLVHIVPAGQTNIVWDSGNLPAPAAADGSYTNMNVGTATFAAGAGTATFADSTATSTNALQLGGIGDAGYSTTNLLMATSNTLAGATALKLDITGTNNLASAALVTATSNTLAAATLAVTNGLPTTAITNGLETVAAAGALTNGFVSASVTNGLATPSVTNGLETTTAANSLTNTFATTNLLTATSNTLAAATLAITNGLETVSVANTLSNTLAAATLAITNGLPTTAVTNGLETIAAAGALTNGLVTGSITNGLAMPSVTNGLETITAAGTLASTNLLTSTSNTLAAATLAVTNGLATTQAVEVARTHAIATNKVANATYADSAGTAASATSAGTATLRGTFTNASLTSNILTITHNLGLSAPYTVMVVVFDNNGNRLGEPDTITGSANSVACDLSSIVADAGGSITGTWGWEVF